MPDFRITVELKDVAMGDAESIAQDIYDEHASTLDRGDFIMGISRSEGSGWFDTGWEATEE